MDHQIEIRFEPDHDPFAEPAQFRDAPASGTGNGRINTSQYERASNPYCLQPLAQNACPQRIHVDDDIGQFGHAENYPFTRG